MKTRIAFQGQHRSNFPVQGCSYGGTHPVRITVNDDAVSESVAVEVQLVDRLGELAWIRVRDEKVVREVLELAVTMITRPLDVTKQLKHQPFFFQGVGEADVEEPT